MKIWKRALPLGMASLMLATTPLATWAASPEFARSEEEWARLQDDTIEYEELAGLVHEYNATVQKNQIDLNEFRKEYGRTNEDVAKRYRELANELEQDISYPSSGDDDYATRMGGIITVENQIKDYRKLADEKLEDIEIKILTYDSAEATLVSTAQNHLVTYYLNQIQLQTDQAQRELLQEAHRSAVNRRAQGLATDVDVLTAEENLKKADQTIQEDQTAIENARQRLIILLGWKHDDTPQIAAVPAVDLNRIAELNPVTDKERALENNFTLRTNKRKYENATSEDTKETLEKTMRENEQNIGASLNVEYQKVLSAKTAYDLAVAQAALEQKNFQTSELQYSLGNISRLDYLKQKNAADTATLNQQAAELKLFQALQSYEWAVNGLASASAM